MKKVILVILIGLVKMLHADDLQCHDIFTTMTSQKGKAPYISEGSKGKGNTKIIISFGKKKVFLISGTDKQELFWLGKGSGASYLLEKTKSGNVNLFTLFNDGTLTISKSYDILGMAKLNVQTIYKCAINTKI